MEPLPKPKAILFDLDGTLFDRDGCVLDIVRNQYDCFPGVFGDVPRDKYISRVLELDDHGYVDKTTVYRQIAQEFSLSQGVAKSLFAHFQDAYSAVYRCFPEVKTTLSTLRMLDVKLGVVTNGSAEVQQRKLLQLGLMELLDVVLVSGREGIRKPDARIFNRALQRLGVDAKEAWHVGDHPIIDVRAAQDAGLVGVWRYTPYWQAFDIAAPQVRGLDELIRMVGEERDSTETSLEFSIYGFPNEKTTDQKLAELLFDVYVGGGFTEREWATTAFRAEEVRKRGEVLVAESDGELLGSVVLNCPSNEFRQIAKDHEAEIHLLAVKSSARKRGIATALIRACEVRAQALGFHAIALSTQPKMLAAQALYRRLGYQRTPDRDWSNKSGKSYIAFEKHLNLCPIQ